MEAEGKQRRQLKIEFAGGGTGGHLFPALSVADELKRRHPEARIGFIGSRRGIEGRLVPEAGYRLRTLPLSGLKGASLAGRLRAAAEAALGVVRCLGWMLASRPDLVIGVGGFASGPGVLAARTLGIRTMVLEQNHFPGATNRWLAGRVDRICVPSEAARERLQGRGTVTGNPVRPEFERIGDPPAGETLSLLVFGGSRGARSINRAVASSLPRLASMPVPPSIVHQTGSDDLEEIASAYREAYPENRYEVHPFLNDMPARLAAADLVVCRAGASTLSELAAAGRPAVLVPYPYAADDHQRHNARAVADGGAAVVILDAEIDGGSIADVVEELAGDPERRAGMAAAARRLAVPGAHERIADVVDELLGLSAAGPREGGANVP